MFRLFSVQTIGGLGQRDEIILNGWLLWHDYSRIEADNSFFVSFLDLKGRKLSATKKRHILHILLIHRPKKIM